jgi:hypothetical protein
MKTHARSGLVLTSLLAAGTLALWPAAFAQSTGSRHGDGKTMAHGKNMEDCQAMMEHHRQAMSETKAQNTALAAQVVEMNRAPDGEKSALLAAIVTTLVEQRTAMHTGEAAMQGKMMGHMMGHSQIGGDSMAQCPMMKEMTGSGPAAQPGRGENRKL